MTASRPGTGQLTLFTPAVATPGGERPGTAGLSGPPDDITAPDGQAPLFGDTTARPPAPVTGVRASCHDPAASDAALAGDGYRWLAALLPDPQAPACERCGRLMVLPAAVPVLWACPACHPGEAS